MSMGAISKMLFLFQYFACFLFIFIYIFIYCLFFISLLIPYVMLNKDYYYAEKECLYQCTSPTFNKIIVFTTSFKTEVSVSC